MSWIKKQYEKGKRAINEEIARKKEVRAAEKEAYHNAQLEQAKVYGRQKAKIETERRLKAVKSGSSGFFGSPAARGNNFNLMANNMVGMSGKTSTRKRKGKKGRQKAYRNPLDEMRLI